MQRDFKLGDQVARIDILGIKGTVTELRGGQVKVRWSAHCEWWILANRLIQVRKQETLRGKEVSHG